MMLSSCLIILVALPVFALTSTNTNSNSNSNSNSNNAPPAESRIPIYRYYSSDLTDHYYTTDYTELRRGDDVYKYEGVGFYLGSHEDGQQNSIPLYQYYDASPAFNHYYTTNPSQIGDRYKEILGFCYPEKYKRDDMVPLYRYYQKEHVDHLYTTATEEIGFNLQVGDFGEDNYQYQGVECYVFASLGDPIIEYIDGFDLEEIPIIKDMQFDINREGDGFHMKVNKGGDDLDGDYNHDELDEIEPVQIGYNRQDDVEQDIALHFPLKDEDENKDGEVSMDYKFILISADNIRDHWGVYGICGLFLLVGIICIFTHFWCYKYSAISTALIKDQNGYEELV